MILVVKFVVLILIWATWFASPEDKHLDGDRIGKTIYSTATAPKRVDLREVVPEAPAIRHSSQSADEPAP